MSTLVRLCFAVAVAVGFLKPVWAADIQAGSNVFQQCAGCHMVGPDAQNRFGPQLNGIIERGPGVADGFDYSPAFVAAVDEGLDWTSRLDAYLASPMSMMPGTKMAYPGLVSQKDRDNVIAYLSDYGLEGERLSEISTAEDDPTIPRPPNKNNLTEQDRLAMVQAEKPTHGILHLGRIALTEEIAAWDLDIRPDGTGLPDGRGNVTDGGVIYDEKCAACHGVFGEGSGRWPVLAGGVGTLTEERPEKTIGSYWPYLSTLYDYIRRAMPFGNARSLSDDEVYAVTAYLLYLNDLVDESFELNQTTFATIRMPNEDGFVEDTRPQEASFEKIEPQDLCMKDCFDTPAKIVQTARILDVTPDDDTD